MKKLNGDKLTFIAAATTILAAMFIGELSRFPAEAKDDILTVAGFLTGIAGIATLIGTKLTENENKRNLKMQYDDNTSRIDNVHANYNHDIKEAFGLISKRTTNNFLAEKTPRHMSQEQSDIIVEKALNKWINENVGANLRGSERPPLVNDNGVWYLRDPEWITLRRNHSVVAQSLNTYYDTYYLMQGPPNRHTYISVIINSGTPSDQLGIGAYLTLQAKELFYKYGKWWDEFRVFFQTHQSFQHVVILVCDDNLANIQPDEVREDVNFWLGNVARRPSLKLDRAINIYSMSDVNATEIVYH